MLKDGGFVSVLVQWVGFYIYIYGELDSVLTKGKKLARIESASDEGGREEVGNRWSRRTLLY